MRIRLLVAYDGAGFHGFAANPGVRTVAGVLADALAKVLRVAEPVELGCAGRTDKGVHALAQVVTFDVPADADVPDLDVLAHRVNRIVGPEVAVRDPLVVADDFDARFSARRRTYRYVVWNRPDPDPFQAGRAWHVPEPLDPALLRLACDPFVGEHDFAAFCRRAVRADGTVASTRRRVFEARWQPGGPGELVFTITGSGFCHQMVRSVVALMVDVGRGRRRAGELTRVIASGDRAATSGPAPPHGLYLVGVDYDP